MNIFEEEIAKYERRVARISGKPNPNMLASNKLFYQAQLEHNRELLRRWQAGKPFVAIGGSGIATLLRAFDNCEPLNLVRIADRLSTKRAEEAFEKVRDMDLPDFICDRTIVFLPLAGATGELPEPKIVLSHTGFCNVMTDTHVAMAKMMGLPAYIVDVPFEGPHQENLGYVTRQLEGLIEFVEKEVPGARYDEARLKEWQSYMHRWYAALHEIHELRMHIPCPEHPRDVFREPVYPGQFTDPNLIVQYYESYRDELKDRVRRGQSGVEKENLRIVWAITGPYGSGVWDYLAGRGVSAFFQFGAAARMFIMPVHGDTQEFGRRLTPLEEEARQMVYNSWGGSGERWIGDTIAACRRFNADGLVLFEQTGCQPVMGLGRQTVQRTETELGIPAWRIEGRMQLGHTEHTEAEFMAGLEAFIDRCFRRKHGCGRLEKQSVESP
ncbi:MAG: 2-hydroxyacyl-CoA dehydratase [Chloroflexi bacterium]|nr:2-hydroxyacyl-CoA dehydratase [Chloroflexota bacterium]